MKIVFLDIDGVLNHPATEVHYPIGSMFYGIEPEKVALLNQLIERTGAKVVISSTWRKQYPIAELRAYLAEQGFTGEVISYTPRFAGHRHFRGDEVQAWLDRMPPVERHVILDDDSDFEPEQPLVQTDCLVGLTQADVDRAVEVLSC